MTTEDVKRLLQANPFEPFEIRLVDGRVLIVRHPDFVLFPPKSFRTMHVFDQNGHETIVNTTIVIRLDPIRPAPARAQHAS